MPDTPDKYSSLLDKRVEEARAKVRLKEIEDQKGSLEFGIRLLATVVVGLVLVAAFLGYGNQVAALGTGLFVLFLIAIVLHQQPVPPTIIERTLNLSDGTLYLKLKVAIHHSHDVTEVVQSWFSQTELSGANKIASYSTVNQTLSGILQKHYRLKDAPQVLILEHKASPLPTQSAAPPPQDLDARWLLELEKEMAQIEKDFTRLSHAEVGFQQAGKRLTTIVPDWLDNAKLRNAWEERKRRVREKFISGKLPS